MSRLVSAIMIAQVFFEPSPDDSAHTWGLGKQFGDHQVQAPEVELEKDIHVSRSSRWTMGTSCPLLRFVKANRVRCVSYGAVSTP